MNQRHLAAFSLAASFALAGAALAGQDNAPAAKEYQVLAAPRSGFSGGTCAAEDADGKCLDPYTVKIDFVSALLYAPADHSLVQCDFERIYTEPGQEEIFDRQHFDAYTGVGEGSLTVVDALRPAAGKSKPGIIELGSCLPYETRLDVGKLRPDAMPESTFGQGLGHRGEGVTQGNGLDAAIFDPQREDRLQTEYDDAVAAGKNPFPVSGIEWVAADHRPYYHLANGAACENTGDYSVAERIVRAYEAGETVSNIPLRGSCPLAP